MHLAVEMGQPGELLEKSMEGCSLVSHGGLEKWVVIRASRWAQRLVVE